MKQIQLEIMKEIQKHQKLKEEKREFALAEWTPMAENSGRLEKKLAGTKEIQ